MDLSNAAIVDGDGHVVERDAELLEFLEEPYCHGDNMLNFPFFPTLDGFHRGVGGARRGVKKGEVNPKTWIEFLDGVGIESTVLYPTAGLGYGLIQDPEWAAILARGYNNWLYHTYRRNSPRLRGAALVPLQAVDEAVKELRRAVTHLNAAAVMLPANGADIGLRKPLGHTDFWPIYAEAERLNCPVAIHGAPSNGLGFDFFTQVHQAATLEHPVALMIQVTSLVASDVLTQFPRLRVAFLEGGTGWVPFMMDRLDRFWEIRKRFSQETDAPRPSDALRTGRVFFSCEGSEESLRYALERLGDDVFIYASDFPHEVDLTHAKEEIQELGGRADIPETTKRKILKDNALVLYSR